MPANLNVTWKKLLARVGLRSTYKLGDAIGGLSDNYTALGSVPTQPYNYKIQPCSVAIGPTAGLGIGATFAVAVGSNAIAGDNSGNGHGAVAIGLDSYAPLDWDLVLGCSSHNVKIPGTLKVGTWTLPSTDGISRQVLTTNGTGTVSWQTPKPATTGNLTFYVDTVTGSDTNPGTSDSPFKTITHADSLVPLFVDHLAFIYVTAGTYDENLVFEHVIGPQGRFCIYGTVVDVVPATGLSTGTIASHDSAAHTVTVTEAGWTISDLKGRLVQIDTGDPAVVYDNTTDTLLLDIAPGSVNGKTFTIKDAGTVIDGDDSATPVLSASFVQSVLGNSTDLHSMNIANCTFSSSKTGTKLKLVWVNGAVVFNACIFKGGATPYSFSTVLESWNCAIQTFSCHFSSTDPWAGIYVRGMSSFLMLRGVVDGLWISGVSGSGSFIVFSGLLANTDLNMGAAIGGFQSVTVQQSILDLVGCDAIQGDPNGSILVSYGSSITNCGGTAINLAGAYPALYGSLDRHVSAVIDADVTMSGNTHDVSIDGSTYSSLADVQGAVSNTIVDLLRFNTITALVLSQ